MTGRNDFATTSARSTRRLLLAIAAVAGTLAVAVAAAVLTSGIGALNLTVERFVGESQGVLGDIGGLLPLGLAFAAGMAAAVNPCGFPLLPAYLGLFLSERDAEGGHRPARHLGRALLVGGSVTIAFIALFTMVGLPIALGARVVVDWLPWVALGLGVVLVAAGGYRLVGGSLYSAVPERLGARLGFGERGVPAYLAFGLAYGLASLSCTLPIFLPVVGLSAAGSSGWTSFGSLALFGLGMGAVIVTLTIATALFRTALTTRLRRVLPYIDRVGTVALFVAGAYLVYYWLTIGGLAG